MGVDIVLSAISFSEPSDFGSFCGGLGSEIPEKGDRAGWREVFQTLNDAERDGLVEIERVDGKIESLQLTEAGANRVRAKLDQSRGLLNL